MRAKAWAYQNGHIKQDGRGRMPITSVKDGRNLTAVLIEAQKSGVKFSDWPKGEITKSKATGEVAVKREAASETGVAELAPYRYPEEEFVAVEITPGKRVERSMRSACNNCRVSLVVCYCESPRIVKSDGSGSVLVRIERRK